MQVSATCVRVPVFIAHSEAVNVEFTEYMGPDEARSLLSKVPGIKVLDDPNVSLYPQPWLAAGTDDVYVGRIRSDASLMNGLVMWIVSDNIRKGAALNAVQIAEEAARNNWVKVNNR
jgi:aspartate-semialdehyde dehydrogenase